MMMVLDKIADKLANNTDFIFSEVKDGVYTSIIHIDDYRLLVELILDESDGIVLVRGTLYVGREEIHTHTYVDDNYEQILSVVEKLRTKATNVVKMLNEFEEQ